MLVFDGDCAFCNRAVRFVLAHERRTDLRFVPRDSELGRRLRRQYSLERVESLLWIEDRHAFIESDAVAHTAAYVGGIYAWLAAALRFIPRPLRNAAYRIFAKVRKRLAFHTRQCMLLTAAQQQRFLQ
jgi:predicted DCC family thiol-disulfide oxidoreductase YuxK